MTAIFSIEPDAHEAAARRAAGWLRDRGLRAGDRVAILAVNHPQTLALSHGALRTGIVPVLVNPHLAAPERDWIVTDADPALTVSSLPEPSLDDAPAADLAPVALARPLHYTSGTTGRQKGVSSGVFDEALGRAWAADEHELWAPERDAAYLVASPLSHSAGHRAATAALAAGSTVLLCDRFDAGTVVRALAEERVTGTFLVPTHLRRIFAGGEPPPPRAATRVLHAGEPCPEALKRRALSWIACLWEFYGSTEGQFTAISPEEWLERPGSVGRARPGRRLQIEAPGPDGIGTVYTSAPAFARWEYWRDPVATEAAWRGDAFTVGDLGSLDDRGYLTLAARREDLVISGGVNVYPAEVERILLEHPLVEDAAVFGTADEQWGQRVCAAVAAPPDAREAISAWCDERLAGAMRPKQLLILELLPKTSAGKTDRRHLRRLAGPAPDPPAGIG